MSAEIDEMKRQRAALLDVYDDIKLQAKGEGRELTAEESGRMSDLMGETERLTGLIDVEERAEAAKAIVNAKPERKTTPAQPEPTARSRRESRIEVIHPKPKFYPTTRDAYAAGQFCLAVIYDRSDAREWCLENGIEVRAQAEGVASAGGVLVPTELESAVISLREKYGVFRANAKVKAMASDHTVTPRRTGGPTVYLVGENAAITATDKSWDQVGLTAKKWAALTRISSEVSEDTIIDIADDIADDMGKSFAQKEDDCGFKGDGSATYGGIRGVNWLLSTTGALAGGLTAPSTAIRYSAFTAADLAAAMGLLPAYAATENCKWYTSQMGWIGCMMRLLMAQSGASATEAMSGARVKRFFGYEVVICQSFPTTNADLNAASARNDVAFLFGDLSQSSMFGDRRGFTVAVDGSRYLEYDQIAVRTTERFDIVNHDVGDGTNPGPIVALRGA